MHGEVLCQRAAGAVSSWPGVYIITAVQGGDRGGGGGLRQYRHRLPGMLAIRPEMYVL